MNNKKVLVALSIIATILSYDVRASQGDQDVMTVKTGSEIDYNEQFADFQGLGEVLQEQAKQPAVLEPKSYDFEKNPKYGKITAEQRDVIIQGYQTCFDDLMKLGQKSLLEAITSLEISVTNYCSKLNPTGAALKAVKYIGPELKKIAKAVKEQDEATLRAIDKRNMLYLVKIITYQTKQYEAAQLYANEYRDELAAPYKMMEEIIAGAQNPIISRFFTNEIMKVLNETLNNWREFLDFRIGGNDKGDIDTAIRTVGQLKVAVIMNSIDSLLQEEPNDDAVITISVLDSMQVNDDGQLAIREFYDKVLKKVWYDDNSEDK